MSPSFGAHLKDLRQRTGLSLRAFCLEHGIDPGNWSKLERGILPPPHGEILVKYAGYLGISEGMDEWLELCDLAAASRGEFPKDILTDQRVVEKLPVLFRTLRGEPVPPEKLNELVELIKKS